MGTTTILIDGNTYRLKWSLRALMAWESANGGKPFAIETMSDQLLFLYCIFCVSNDVQIPDVAERVTYSEFVDALSEDESIGEAFNAVLADVAKKKKLQPMEALQPRL